MAAMVTQNTHPGSHGSNHEHIDVEFDSDAASASHGAVVTAPASPWERRLCTLICFFLKYASSSSYYGARFFSLHHFWFTIYRLAPTARDSDMENAGASHRISWTEAVNRMQKVWTLTMTVPIVIIPTSVAFLQIQDVLNRVFPRTFAVLACILSGASFAAGYIFIANATSLDCDEKCRQWESASLQPNTLPSLDFWACMSLPLTSMVWSIGFCTTTLFSLAWIHQGTTVMPATSKIDLALGYALMAFVIFGLMFQFYRVRRFLPER